MPHSQKERHILVALDQSENATRVVQYVASLLSDLPGLHVTLLTVIAEACEDFRDDAVKPGSWIEKQREAAVRMIEDHRDVLIRHGLREDRIAIRLEVMHCPSVAESILDIRRRLDCRTIVIGRGKMATKEEAAFGSTADALLRASRECVVWVVE